MWKILFVLGLLSVSFQYSRYSSTYFCRLANAVCTCYADPNEHLYRVMYNCEVQLVIQLGVRFVNVVSIPEFSENSIHIAGMSPVPFFVQFNEG